MADDSADRVERLESDRDQLERAMTETGYCDECGRKGAEGSQLAALVREHRAVLKEIAALAKPKKGSVRDQLAEKRAAREAGPAGSAASEV